MCMIFRIMAVVVVELVAAELDGLHERVAGRFGRAEPRARVREDVGDGQLSRCVPLGPVICWSMVRASCRTWVGRGT